MGEQGLLCVEQPEEHGGMGTPLDFSVVAFEEAVRMGLMSLFSKRSVHSDIVSPYILRLGNEAQDRKYPPRMIRGECSGSIGMTEPAAGSDLQGIEAFAVPDGEDHPLINGSKTFITKGQNSGSAVLAAKTDPSLGARGTTLLALDTSSPRFQARPQSRHGRPVRGRYLADVLRQRAGFEGRDPQQDRRPLRAPGRRTFARALGA